MAELTESFLKVSQAQVLYNDLRKRIDTKASTVHTHVAEDITNLEEYLSTVPVGVAERAIGDELGDNIVNTYARKDDLKIAYKSNKSAIEKEASRAQAAEAGLSSGCLRW